MSSAVRSAGASASSTAARRAATPAAARAAPVHRAMRTAATADGNGAEPEQQQRRPRSLATLLVHSEGLVNDPFAASMPPIYQVSGHCVNGWHSMWQHGIVVCKATTHQKWHVLGRPCFASHILPATSPAPQGSCDQRP